MLAVLDRSLHSSRSDAIAVAFGIATGSLLWSTSTNFGLGLLTKNNPTVVFILALFGGLYFMNMAVKRFLSRAKTFDIDKPTIKKSNKHFFKQMFHGFVVVVSNPKAAFFWVSLSVIVSKSGFGFFPVLLLCVACALTALLVYTTEAVVFSSKRARTVYSRGFTVFDPAFSLIYFLLGGYLLWYGVSSLSLKFF